MGHEISKITGPLECTGVEKQILDFVVVEDDGSTASEAPSTTSDEVEVINSPSHASTRLHSPASSKGRPVIVFDWDDTLLSSTMINTSTWTLSELEDLERAGESILKTAMSLGETLVVTNGNATWVQDSANRFLPNLLPTLAKIRVVSARAMYETEFPGDPYQWKRAAFFRLFKQDRAIPADTGLNLIAIGDQLPEIEAARAVVGDLGKPSRAKTVKFKEQPTIPQLLGQLACLERELAKLVADEGTVNRCLMRRESSSHPDRPISQAASWKMTTMAPGDCPRGVPAPRSLSMKDLWPFFS